MEFSVGQHIKMKKPHPCGCKLFSVTRAGMDFKIQCQKCGRLVEAPRLKVERNIKRIIREGQAE